MVGRVPTSGRNVDPAARRQIIVDHHDLLVVAAARRVRRIETEIDRVGLPPPRQPDHRLRPEELLHRTEIPLENVDLALGLVAGEVEEKAAQRLALAMLVGIERDPRIEVPPDNEDAFLRGEHRPADMAIIIGRIDDHAGFAGARDPPAIVALPDYWLKLIA